MRYLFLLAATLLFAGCGSIAKEYVDADRKTYNAVEPVTRAYVEADEDLDQGSKDLIIATLESWDYRLRQAEKAGDE